MRVIAQLITHLHGCGHLTAAQLAELTRRGLVKDEPSEDDHAQQWQVDADPATEPADALTDLWDAYGDRLLNDARRATGSGRKRSARRTAEYGIVPAVERALLAEQEFLDIVFEVARRIAPGIDAASAPRLVSTVDPVRLDAVLMRDSLWARLWPHLLREPIVSTLDEREKRRFLAVVAAGRRSNKSIPQGLLTEAVVRRAVDIICVHRELSRAFGRVASAIDPRRAFSEIDLSADRMAYEVLVILHSARTARRTVAELPHLATDVGLPTLRWLNTPQFDSGWAVAARIDPANALPFMQWCIRAWSAPPPSRVATCQELGTDHGAYRGRAVPESASEWFSLKVGEAKWVRLHCISRLDAQPGEHTQSIIRDGVEYRHYRPVRDCETPRRFYRADSPEILRVTWSVATLSYTELSRARGDYGAMWAAGLLDMPLLTCPKEWEWT